MQSYNLDQEAGEAESFDFILGGNTYHFRYPSTEEVTRISKMKLPDGSQDVGKVMETIYGFIRADEGVPNIKEVLDKSRIQVFKAFQHMTIAELGLQES